MKTKLALLLFAAFSSVTCQKSKSYAVYGGVSGKVINGQTGGVLSGATIFPVDRPTVTATTDGTGAYLLDALPADDHVFRASATGFNTQDFTAKVPKNATASNVNFILLPTAYAANRIVIVLTWGAAPADLDSHLWVPNGGPYREVFYGDTGEPTLTADPFASLDVDDTDAMGPETTTVSLSSGLPHYAGAYRFYVHNFSGDELFTNSSAQVMVYADGVLLKTYNVPTTGAGIYWHVFDLQGSTITDVNALTDTQPASP